MEYYLTRHMPMVQQKLGPACKRMAVEEGIAGGAPGTPAIYVAMGHLYFDSTDAFQTAFAPHAQSILADIPNYTNTQPTIQVSEVRLWYGSRSEIRRPTFGTTATRCWVQVMPTLVMKLDKCSVSIARHVRRSTIKLTMP